MSTVPGAPLDMASHLLLARTLSESTVFICLRTISYQSTETEHKLVSDTGDVSIHSDLGAVHGKAGLGGGQPGSKAS